MSFHLGLHWNMFVSMAKKQLKPSKLRTAVIRIIAVIIAGYGVYAFIRRDVGVYMFLKSHFVFYDFSEPVICFLIDYLAVMGSFVFVGDLAGKLIKLILKRVNKA